VITLTTNLKGKSTAQFDGWNFNSFANFNGTVLSACGSGLHIVGGKTDNGDAIDSYLKLTSNDLGIDNNKRFRILFFGVKTDGDLEVEITVDGRLVRTRKIPYKADGDNNIEVPCGRDLHGRWWVFNIKSKNGSSFSLYTLHGVPIILGHGRR